MDEAKAIKAMLGVVILLLGGLLWQVIEFRSESYMVGVRIFRVLK